jgi:hypothetical protein
MLRKKDPIKSESPHHFSDSFLWLFLLTTFPTFIVSTVHLINKNNLISHIFYVIRIPSFPGLQETTSEAIRIGKSDFDRIANHSFTIHGNRQRDVDAGRGFFHLSLIVFDGQMVELKCIGKDKFVVV